MSQAHTPIQQLALALKEGNKLRARRLAKVILQDNPSADAWFLAAHAMESDEQRIRCLKQALELDPWHQKANRMLLKLEDSPRDTREMEMIRQTQELTQTPGMKNVLDIKREGKPLEFQKRAKRRKRLNRMLVIGFLVLSMSCTVITFSLIGVIQGPLAFLIQLGGGPAPVTELDGTPIRDVRNAAATIEPARQVENVSEDVNVLEHGYVHEYSFEVRSGDEVSGYVQFMSVSADDVEANVLIVNPRDQIVGRDVCNFLGEAGLLGGDGNVTFTCFINVTGTWRIRMLGVNGESVGAYFVGVETLD